MFLVAAGKRRGEDVGGGEGVRGGWVGDHESKFIFYEA